MLETKMTLLVKRTFKAPREKVFAAWTQAEALQKWWGTEGHTVPRVEMDLKIGGKYRIEMRTAEGESFYLNGAFVEIRPPRAARLHLPVGARGMGLSRNAGERGFLP